MGAQMSDLTRAAPIRPDQLGIPAKIPDIQYFTGVLDSHPSRCAKQRNLEGRSASILTRVPRENHQPRLLMSGAVKDANGRCFCTTSPVTLEPIGEALRHNTIAILNGMSNSDPFANTVETAQVARPIPARLGPPHTFLQFHVVNAGTAEIARRDH